MIDSFFYTNCFPGNSKEVIRGHSMFMENPKPIIGYHGLYGFRRNTPWLRQKPSVFIGKLCPCILKFLAKCNICIGSLFYFNCNKNILQP